MVAGLQVFTSLKITRRRCGDTRSQGDSERVEVKGWDWGGGGRVEGKEWVLIGEELI